MWNPGHSKVKWWRRVESQTGCLQRSCQAEGDGAPPGGAPFAWICGWKKEGCRPPGVPGTRPPTGLRGRPLPAGEGLDPGAGAEAPRLRRPGRATACGSARRCAPAGLALHSPSLHQRLRELGRDPSLAHFPPSQTRTLPRSRSLTPSLSLAHTHARTRRRGSLSRSRSPSGSSGRPPGSGLARQRRGSRPTQRPEAAGLGEPRAAPRGKSAGCRGRGDRIAGEGRLPSREGAPWPAGAARQAARGGEPPAAGGARVPAPGPRAPPPLGRAGREGVSHVQTFPGAEPSRLSARSHWSPPAPHRIRRAPRSLWDPGGSPGGSAGGQARAPKGAGEVAHSLDTGTGTQAFPAPPTLFYQVSAPGPLPEAGSEPGNNSTA